MVALVLATPFTAAAAGKCDRLVATGAADNPPFLWRDPQNPKRLIGANADLLGQIADSLDLKLDLLYTGDRTKALEAVRSGRVDVLADATLTVQRIEGLDFVHPRSEERSVGKESVSPWRSRWSPYTEKKKKKNKYTQ